ncbi:ABC-F family ATP-binding cassette domain-containing protein [Aquamicrobium sp. LC103]|nr:ABC-F family ATP-binding cassette domain-containing protein [Aquamicrobium sp. LC103]
MSLRNISYTTPDGRNLLENLELGFGRERTGLVGRNGVGKSTLLKLVTGELRSSAGSVHVEGTLRQLRQEVQADEDATVADALGVSAALARLRRALSGEGTPEDVATADWTLDERLQAVLVEVGLEAISPDRRLASLSGGQRTRVALAALIFGKPDMILLDEPTNNLDREGRALVARLLEGWSGGAIVVSHDRELLRRMDRIVELSSLGVRVYGGNWDAYVERKEEERAVAEQKLAGAEQQMKLVARKVQIARERQAKRDAQGRRKRAQSSDPRILLDAQQQRAENTAARGSRLAERQSGQVTLALEEARNNVERVKRLSFGLSSTRLPGGRTVLSFEAVSGGYDPSSPILHGLGFAIIGPERVALAGPNGSGKTTVLKLALGELDPFEGRVHRPVPAAMLDQHVAMLDRDETILENFRRLNPSDTDNSCRAALARFLFRADDALRRVGMLSGGEMLRAGLACVLGGSRTPQLLILDEPTNHLDIDSVAAIEAGLNGYDGALLVVSHDADFLQAIEVERTIKLGTTRPVEKLS